MAVLKYSLLRLGVFAVVFFACLYLDLGRFTMIFALVCGLVISWAVAYLFFNRLRLEAGEQLARRFGGPRKVRAGEADDNAAEDELAEEFHRTQDGPGRDELAQDSPPPGPDAQDDDAGPAQR